MALKLMESQVVAYPEEVSPSSAQLHLSIGESWFKLGELEQALSAFQQALEHLQPSVGAEIYRAFPSSLGTGQSMYS